jgi:hypothetical protein
MGSSGHKFIAHTKSLSPPAQAKDGGYGEPPHPLALRTGQRFWPLHGNRKRPFFVRSVDTQRNVVVGQRLDEDKETVRFTVGRLLATDADGRGRHYRFFGFMPRRYTTWATVVAIDRSEAVLILPEWHPSHPVRMPARLLPPRSATEGTWLRCTADLSEGRGARLSVSDLQRVNDPGPDVCHRPVWTPPSAAIERRVKVRDIVLDLPGAGLEAAPLRGGLLDLYVSERPAELGAGDRVFLAHAGSDAIVEYLVVHGVQSRPMGTVLRCDPEPRPLGAPVPLGTKREAHRWRRRWWDEPDTEDE